MLQSRQSLEPARRQKQSPVYAAAYQFDQRNTPAAHAHALGQLTYCPKGRVMVDVAGRRVHVDPSHALWIPGGMEHLLHTRGTREAWNLYLAPDFPGPALARQLALFMVGPFERALIAELVRTEAGRQHEPQFGRMLAVLKDRLVPDAAGSWLATSPAGEDPRLREMHLHFATGGELARLSLSQWADRLHVSPRTLERRIRKAMNCGFDQWRRTCRMAACLDELVRTRSVKAAALSAGYASASAFSQAFRRVYGVSPTGYFAPKANARGRTSRP